MTVKDYHITDVSLLDLPSFERVGSIDSPFANVEEVQLTEVERKVLEINRRGLTVSDWEQLVEEGFNSGREAGYVEGSERGQKNGYNEGIKEAQTVIDAKLSIVENFIEELKKPINHQREMLEGTLMSLVLKISGIIANKSLAEDEERIKVILTEAIDAIPPSDDKTVISISPNDRGILQDVATKNGWELVNDEQIAQGGLKVDSGLCHVDGTVSSVINEAVEAFKSQMAPEARERIEPVKEESLAAAVNQPADSRSKGRSSARASGSASSSRTASRASSTSSRTARKR